MHLTKRTLLAAAIAALATPARAATPKPNAFGAGAYFTTTPQGGSLWRS